MGVLVTLIQTEIMASSELEPRNNVGGDVDDDDDWDWVQISSLF